MDRALALFLDGKFESAEVLLAAAPANAGVQPMVLHLRGLAAMHLGRMDRAGIPSGGHPPLDPRNSTWHFGLAKALAAASLCDLESGSLSNSTTRRI
jgi:hypothetical protein